MVKKAVGNPVRGEDFYDREEEQRLIWDQLQSDSLLLLAPRRVGKTSLMLRLQDTASGQGFLSAYLSVAGVKTELDFVTKLCEAVFKLQSSENQLKKLAKGPLGQWFRRIRKAGPIEFAERPQEQWRELGQELTREINELKGSWLLQIDELPIFVLTLLAEDEKGGRARDFLNWFRRCQGPYDEARIRWLLAGSIGLDTVAARLKLGGTINDLLPTHLGPFKEPAVHSFLGELAKTYKLELPREVRVRIVERIGWPIPYYLQLMFSELLAYRDDRGQTPTPAAVDAVFEGLLSPAKKNLFDYWRQRLEEELGAPDHHFASALLSAIARDDSGASKGILEQVMSIHVQSLSARNEKLRYLIDVLVSEGYIFEESRRYVFRSPLLRAFWLRRVAP